MTHHQSMDFTRRPDVVAGFDLPSDAPAGTPAKRIRTSADIEAFIASDACAGLKRYLSAWCAAAQLTPRSEVTEATTPDRCPAVVVLLEMLEHVSSLAKETPLQQMNVRYGNPAYRVFHAKLVEEAPAWMRRLAALRTIDDCPEDELVQELTGYLLDSFGNATRIDYGTGHELHFVLLLYIANAVGCFGTSNSTVTTQHVVFLVFWRYVDVMRQLQSYFVMEPAGTHGVWGLDDYHHVPFIVGASQLSTAALDALPTDTPFARIDPASVPAPTSINDAATVAARRDDFLYYAMIQWIRDKKRGPFHEHSSVLYNVSGVDEWQRIATGMFKMFEGEVLKKINIVQHLLFGRHFAFTVGSGGGGAAPAAAVRRGEPPKKPSLPPPSEQSPPPSDAVTSAP